MREGCRTLCGFSMVGDNVDGAGEGVTTVTSQWNDEAGGANPTLATNRPAKKTAVPCRQSEIIHPLARKRTKASGVPA